MAKRRLEKDLFGNPVRKRKPRLQSILEKYDRETLQDRVVRLRYVNAFFPKGYWFGMSVEAASLFSEAKMAFINGEYISTILLSLSFTEHWLGSYLASRGYPKRSFGSLSSIANTLRKEKSVPEYLLSPLDELRLLRNPFVHLKESDHPQNLERRMFSEQMPPYDILEKDAKEALALMYQIAVFPKRR
jgi:hypothetical protein